MPTITEVRAQYPQYADMPDAALADALYKKFYSDLPRAQFDSKLGIKPIATSETPYQRKSLAELIPGNERNFAKPEAPLSTSEKIRGVIETPFAVGANLVSGPITYLSGALGPEAQQVVARNIQYQPRTRMAQNVLEGIGKATEGLPPYMADIGMMGKAGNALAPAMQAIGDVAKSEGSLVSGTVGNALANRAAKTLEGKVAESYQRGPLIDAATKANELGIAINPAVSNPTKANKIKSVITGNQNIDAKLAEANAPKWTNLAKKEMGLPESTVLDASAFEKARDLVSEPYDVIKGMPALAPSPEIGAKLNKLRQGEELIGGAPVKAAIDALVSDAEQKIGAGMPGNSILTNIRQMRKEAQDVYKSQKLGAPLSPEQMALADTKLGIANTLESLIEENIKNPNDLSNFRKARVAMAKTYAYEDATDLNTGKVDPIAIAKITAKDNKLTGTIADIGKVAGNFPDIAKVGPPSASMLPTLTRSGLGGSIGYAAGSMVGMPLQGAILGAGIGGMVGRAGAKRIATPGYQATHAIPEDFRPPINNLNPANINYGPNQLVPYDYSQSVLTPEEMPYVPNWRPGQPTPNVTVSPLPPGPPQLNAPSAESTMGMLRAEQERKYGMEKSLAEQRNAQAEAQSQATRKPASGEVILDINPLTGVPEISKGLKGATPETFQNFGSSLASAANKVSSGKMFDMTLAEKAAWKNTRIDLAEVAPGFKSLTDKDIAIKMMDRSWVEDAITKAREKAAMFDDLSKRIAGEQAKRDAAIKRDQMFDLLDTLEKQLSKPRPTSLGGQGPKTRAAKINALAPDQNQNKLAP